MLIGSGELIEQGGLAAVLVACQRKTYGLSGRDLFLHFAAPIGHRFPHPWMRHSPPACLLLRLRMGRMRMGQLHHGGIRFSQRQLISPEPQLQRIPQRRSLYHGDLRPRCQPHIKDMLAQGWFLTLHRCNIGVLSRFQFIKGHSASLRLLCSILLRTYVSTC